jgi:hypothetical protein
MYLAIASKYFAANILIIHRKIAGIILIFHRKIDWPRRGIQLIEPISLPFVLLDLQIPVKYRHPEPIGDR